MDFYSKITNNILLKKMTELHFLVELPIMIFKEN